MVARNDSRPLVPVADTSFVTRVELAIAAERRAFAASTSAHRPEAGALEIAGGCAVYTGDGLFSNRALAVGIGQPVDDADLDEIERFYTSRGRATEIELASVASPELVRLLADRGYRLRRFRNIFARACEEAVPEPDERVSIEKVDDTNRSEWSAALVEGFGYDEPEAIERVREWNRALLATPGLTALVARLDGDVAGSASVFVSGATAVLGGAATIPRLRRRGVQLQLIAARLRLARAAGCDLAVVTADPGSSSGRNTERAGFKLVCTHAVMIGTRARSDSAFYS